MKAHGRQTGKRRNITPGPSRPLQFLRSDVFNSASTNTKKKHVKLFRFFYFQSAFNCRFQTPKNIQFFNQESWIISENVISHMVKDKFLICTQSWCSLFWAETHPPPSKVHQTPLFSHCAILLTNQQNNKQANRNGLKQLMATKTCLWVLNNAENAT